MRSIVLVHDQRAVPDHIWVATEALVTRLRQHESRIRSWEYDENAILYGSSNVKATLGIQAKILSNAIEKDHITVSPWLESRTRGITGYQADSRPIFFVAYSLGGLVVKEVSSLMVR